MELKEKFSRRRLLTIGISCAVGLGIAHLIGHFRNRSRSREKTGTVLPVPGADGRASYTFAITPGSPKIVCIEERLHRQNVYLADFPPESSESYQKILTLPNFNWWSSNPAFCGADASKFAMIGCYFRSPDVPEFLDFQNDEEFESWQKAHPEYVTPTVNGVTEIDYSLAGFYLVITDLGEKKSDFLVRIPDEIARNPSRMAPSLCWPLRDLLFLSAGKSVYQISLRDSEPSFEKILTLPDTIENSVRGSVRGLYYDTEKNVLSAAVIYRETVGGSIERSTLRMANVKFDVREGALLSADLAPEPIWPRAVVSSDNSGIAAVAVDNSLIRTYIQGEEKICVMSLKEDDAYIADATIPISDLSTLEAVSPDGSVVIYSSRREYRYLRIG